LKGVPPQEHEEYFRNPEACWRCGQKGHRTYECFAHTTCHGTTLPKAPWKAAGVTEAKDGKRKREDRADECLVTEQQKVAAVETMDMDAVAPLWEDSESDF